MLPILCSVHFTSRTKLVRGGLGWRKGKAKGNAYKRRKTKKELAAEEHGASAAYYPPNPQYKPAYEEDPPIMRDLPPEPTHEGHLDHHKIEEEKRQMLELLKEESNFDYYSDSDSDPITDIEYLSKLEPNNTQNFELCLRYM